jgi:hypothetical protein
MAFSTALSEIAGLGPRRGVPTRLENGAPMKYDGGTARRLAKIAVKKVYQHTASVPLAKATPRQKELMDQRSELARQFREKYASRQDDKSDYPFFIGVFDTVASIASKGSLIILVLAVLAVAAVFVTGFWFAQPVAEMVFGSTRFFAGLAALIHFDTASWWHWFFAVLSGFVLTTFIWYVTQQVKFAPTANPKKWWRTLNISFR